MFPTIPPDLTSTLPARCVAEFAHWCSRLFLPDPWAGSSTRLKVPHIRQEPWLCVPTSAAMVLAFDGYPRSARELKCLAARRPYDPSAPFHDHTITRFSDLVAGLRGVGVHWRYQTFGAGAAGFLQGMRRVAASLRAHRPVIVDTAIGTGHTLVLVGIDAAARTLHAIDPDMGAPGHRTFGADEFEHLWHSRAVGFDGRGAIFTHHPHARDARAGR